MVLVLLAIKTDLIAKFKNMKITIKLIIILFFITQYISNSVENKSDSIYFNKKYWMIEFLGHGYGLTFNYDGLLFSDSLNSSEIRFRNGIGISILAIHSPHTISYTYGKKHKFEIGLGVTLDYAPKAKNQDSIHISSVTYSRQVVKLNAFIGYKFIKENGTYWRIGYTPWWSFDGIQNSIHLAGISYGF
jgi:hypothetical protein